MKKINLIEAQRELRKNAKKDQAWSEKDQVGTKLSSKEAGVLKLEGGSNQHPISTQSASDEHPISIRSASDGERWNSRIWKHVACMLCVLMLGVGQMWGTTITWTFDNSANNSDVDLASKSNDLSSYNASSIALTYQGGSSCKIAKKTNYLSMGGASTWTGSSTNGYTDRYFTFKAPSTSGTISITYASSNAGSADILTTLTGYPTVKATISGATSSTVTSQVITGLTTGTTDLYIVFPSAKAYIESITWTDATLSANNVLYSSDYKSTMESGGTLTTSSGSIITSSLPADKGSYSTCFKTTGSTGYATVSFSSALSLTSDASDAGYIEIEYSHSSDGKGFDLYINGGGSSVASHAVLKATRGVHTIRYTIPKNTESISSIKAAGSGSTTLYLFHVKVVTHAASGYTVTYANGGATSGSVPVDASSPYAADAEVTILDNTGSLAKTGYTFAGWSANVDLTIDEETVTAGTTIAAGTFPMPSSNVTLTAVWTALQDKFQDKEHGNSQQTISGANKTTPTLSNFTPVNEYCNDLHYKFIGWVISTSVNDDGTLKNDAVIMPGGQGSWNCTGATYYAVWAAENK